MLLGWLRRRFGTSDDPGPQIQDRLDEAAACIGMNRDSDALLIASSVLERHPRSVRALQLQGTALAKSGKREEAIDSFRKALVIDPGNASLYCDLGNTLVLAGDKEEAELQFRIALERNPSPEIAVIALRALGSLLYEMRRIPEAIDCFERAYALSGQSEEFLRLLAFSNYAASRYEVAYSQLFSLHDKGVTLSTDERRALGESAVMTGRLALARDVLTALLEENPDNAKANFSLGFAYLFSGELKEGFQLFEFRFEAVKDAVLQSGLKSWYEFVLEKVSRLPLWKGDSLAGRRLLLWTEQGFGDVIMMMRFFPMLRSRYGAVKVTFVCPPPLASFQDCFPEIELLPYSPDKWPDCSEYDAHCSVLSLPYLLGIHLADLATCAAPYLRPSKQALDEWTTRLASVTSPRIGIVWAGGTNLSVDAVRSLHLADMVPLLVGFPEIRFFSLQKDEAPRKELAESGLSISDLMDQCSSFADTAAFVDQLDLVISADTAVAHLAGAMGKPVWLMNRHSSEWRWMQGRTDSAWYPSMRIFTQKEPGDWASVVSEIKEALPKFLSTVRHR